MAVTPIVLEDEDNPHNRVTITGQFNPEGRLIIEVLGMKATGVVNLDREQIIDMIEFLSEAIELPDLPYSD